MLIDMEAARELATLTERNRDLAAALVQARFVIHRMAFVDCESEMLSRDFRHQANEDADAITAVLERCK